METFSRDNAGYKFSYEIINEGKLQYKLRADKIEWNEKEKLWRLRNYFICEYKEFGEKIMKGTSLDTMLNFEPKDFFQRVNVKEEMNTLHLCSKLKRCKNAEWKKQSITRLNSTAERQMRSRYLSSCLLCCTCIAQGAWRFRLAYRDGIALSASFIIFTRFPPPLPPMVTFHFLSV